MWIRALRRYFFIMASGNFIWEMLHMPLYSVWEEGTRAQIFLYGVHCTGGDILIGFSALIGSLVLFGSSAWPNRGFTRIAVWTIAFGVGYTIFSEWHNVYISGSWAYRDIMPQAFGIGLSPLLQWLAIPSAAFWWMKKAGPRKEEN